jgi:hypothetical protein
MFVWAEDDDAHRHARARLHESHRRAREAMYRRELEDRAALLLRLGRRPPAIKARLAANVAWDFELHGKPSHAAEVDKIVDAVVRRQSVKP